MKQMKREKEKIAKSKTMLTSRRQSIWYPLRHISFQAKSEQETKEEMSQLRMWEVKE